MISDMWKDTYRRIMGRFGGQPALCSGIPGWPPVG